MCGGGSGNQTTISKTEPPDQVKPYLTPYMEQAKRVSEIPFEAYGGKRVADWTSDQQQGFGQTRQAVGMGGVDNAMGRYNMYSTLGGAHLGGSGSKNPFAGMDNPYLNDAIKNAQSDTTHAYRTATAPQTDAAFARAGAFGGSAWGNQVDSNERTLGNALGRQATDMRMGDYTQQMGLAENQTNRDESAFQSERARQMAAMNGSGQFMQNDLRGAQAMLGIGDAQQGMSQDLLNNDFENWQGAKNAPYQSLQTMQNAIGSIMGAGGTNTTTAPAASRANRTSGALGGALAGAQIAGPWGALGGGILGLLG